MTNTYKKIWYKNKLQKLSFNVLDGSWEMEASSKILKYKVHVYLIVTTHLVFTSVLDNMKNI